MEFTPKEKKAMAFISTKAKSGVCASFREVQAVLCKRSFGQTVFFLERLRDAGFVKWQPKGRRTLRPTKKGGQGVAVAPMYSVGETVKLPFEKWPQRDALWLDPQLLRLLPTRQHIVLEVGSSWKPALLDVSPGDRVVVARPHEVEDFEEFGKGTPIVVHLGESVVVARLGYEARCWITVSPQCKVTSKNLIGIVVAVIKLSAGIHKAV